MAEETTTYNVLANLRFRGFGTADAPVMRLANNLRQMGASLRGNRTLAGGLTRQLLTMGGTYLGIRAITGTFRMAAREAFGFSAELEKTKIGLASVFSAVEGVNFTRGMQMGEEVFRQLTDDAVRTTATTKQLFDTYQGIVGPIRAAGGELATVREITNNTIAAATALGVDLPQASRDIQLMVRGTAGMDTRLFSILRSVGAIKEDTASWNKELTTPQRVEKLRVALAGFGTAAVAYEKSWAGTMSTFVDIIQILSATAAGPAFEAIKKFVGGINQRLMQNRTELERYLRRIGNRFGDALETMFSRVNAGIDYTIAHWDDISRRITDAVAKMREIAPQLVKAAKAFVVFSAAKATLGVSLQGLGMLTGAIGQVSGLLGTVMGGAVGGAGAGAGAGAGESVLAVLAPALAPLAAIVAAIAGAVTLAVDQWDNLVQIFDFLRPTINAIWADFQEVAGLLWEVLRPILKLIGLTWLPIFVAGFMGLVTILRAVLVVLKFLLQGLAWLADKLEYVVDLIADLVFGALSDVAHFIASLIGDIEDEQARARTRYTGPSSAEQFRQLEAELGTGGHAGMWAPQGQYGQEPTVPSARQTITNDFRGSRINVKQEFREADPDRIAVQLINDIQRQAEQRTQSGYANPFTR